MTKLLEAKNIGITFGGLKAVNGFELALDYGELVGLIGPNGAGKTTVFNMISGVYRPSFGELLFEGQNYQNCKTYQLAQKGIVRTFQNIRLFSYMTVLENVLAAYNFNMKYNVFQGAFRTPAYWHEEKHAKEKAFELLRIFGLERFANYQAGNLPYGQQRKLEITRAMATEPKLLLLDEPAAGMNPKETEALMELIALIRKRYKIAILLIEHDMKLVLGICERLIVLDHGQIIAQGIPNEVVNDKAVITAYLGSEDMVEAVR